MRGPRGRPSEGPLREGQAHGEGVGPGPGPAHEGINSYSAQERINSKGNIIDLFNAKRGMYLKNNSPDSIVDLTNIRPLGVHF